MQINIKIIEFKAKELGVGQVFGLEEVLLKDVERCIQAKAVTECEVQYIESDDVHQILNEEGVELILNNGELNFVQPVQIAKEFINHKKAII
jgi:CRP-like cAMP-binding protein